MRTLCQSAGRLCEFCNSGPKSVDRLMAIEMWIVPFWWIGKRRAYCDGCGRKTHMQERETNNGTEPRLGLRICEARAREMDEVLSRCLPSFHRQAHRYLGNAADAEDVVQDALISAFRHLNQFRGQAQMSTWVNAIVMNCARMQLRRRRQTLQSLDEKLGDEERYSVSERLADCGPSPEDECRRSELHGHILRFVTQLSPPLRKAFQLRELDGLSTSEAAQVLGVADGTVKARLARARAKLKRMMSRMLGARHRSALAATAYRRQRLGDSARRILARR
jgi:RNA polymerase sigma-70 factor (ECF subfamily)